MTRARALTLVEILAAAVILAAAGAAMASVLRDASSAARRARLQRDALLAYEAWRNAADADQSRGPWEWRDPRGVLWRVTMTNEPAPLEGADDAVALGWGAVVVEAWREASSAGGAYEVVFTAPRVRRATPAEAAAP